MFITAKLHGKLQGKGRGSVLSFGLESRVVLRLEESLRLVLVFGIDLGIFKCCGIKRCGVQCCGINR